MGSGIAGVCGRRLGADVEDRKQCYAKGDRLKQLRAFCQTARLGSLSRAAEQLTSSQPAVSLQVSALEEELGLSLFDRRGPNMILTRVGESLYQLAMPLVQGMDRLPDTFAEQHHGVFTDILRVGAGQLSAAYLLPAYLKQFQQQCPGTRIEVRTGSGRQRLHWLRAYEIDLVVAAMDVPRSDLEFHPILASDPVLITPEDHPLAGRTSVTMEEIAAYPIVGHASTHYIRQIMETILRLQGVAPDVVVEVDGWGVLTNYVAAGIGVSFVPELCLTEQHRLWRIPVKGILPQRKYGAITRRDGLLALAARRFLRIMVPEESETRGKS